MAAEKFLNVFFTKLIPGDFQKNKFLEGFYKFYFKENHSSTMKKLVAVKASKELFMESAVKLHAKTKHKHLFSCYFNYLTRNKQYKDSAEKTSCLDILYDAIVSDIMRNDDQRTDHAVFDREMAKPFLNLNDDNNSNHTSNNMTNPTPNNNSNHTPNNNTNPTTSNTTDSLPANLTTSNTQGTKKKTSVKINKQKALKILSNYIEQSHVIEYEDPAQEIFQEDQEFRENTTDRIAVEIIADGRVLPEPKKDVVFGQRNVMMNIWKDSEKKCIELLENQQLASLITKTWFIDLLQFKKSNNLPIASITTVNTIDNKELKEVLPVEYFDARYTNAKYQTNIKLVNANPVDEAVTLAKQKLRCLYIVGGSQMISGGNADQGIDVTESLLYMTSSYSCALQKALHTYPLSLDQALLCPQVLVFKDSNYKVLPPIKWQRIAVLNAPCKFRPRTNLTDQNTIELDTRLFDKKVEMRKPDVEKVKKTLIAALEVALFFEYDNIILDDRGIEDNWLPAHQIAEIIKECISKFPNRFNNILICTPKARIFKVFRLYF